MICYNPTFISLFITIYIYLTLLITSSCIICKYNLQQ